MSVDFFEYTSPHIGKLNANEKTLFDYVVKNISEVKDMSIQKLAATRYLSTTTIFRFTKKLGFAGYNDFIRSLQVTDFSTPEPEIPNVLRNSNYSSEYLKNAVEAVRVLRADHLAIVKERLAAKPNIYIFAEGHSADIGRYVERLFMGLGIRAYFPEADYQITAALDYMKDEDMILVLSYRGSNPRLVRIIETAIAVKRPFILSITRSDNNIIQNMSDVNFYIFADEISSKGFDLTSRVSMLMILELLVYDVVKES